MLSNHSRGILAEFLAKLILILKGYKILESRFKTNLGEIDIICSKNKKIIFIEVKSRKNHEAFFDVITSKQQYRIIRTSQIFLKKRKIFDKEIRYDVIFIKLPFYIKHIHNAFAES